MDVPLLLRIQQCAETSGNRVEEVQAFFFKKTEIEKNPLECTYVAL